MPGDWILVGKELLLYNRSLLNLGMLNSGGGVYADGLAEAVSSKAVSNAVRGPSFSVRAVRQLCSDT